MRYMSASPKVIRPRIETSGPLPSAVWAVFGSSAASPVSMKLPGVPAGDAPSDLWEAHRAPDLQGERSHGGRTMQ